MKNQPKVSIIVPVYNVEEYLAKCLDSLVNQTLKEIEIICINDGSTDNSLEILNTYAQKDKRVIVIDKKNEGQGIARNLGITQANGEYIGFVDPDDWVSSDMYEKMYNQAKELNSEIVVCDFIKSQDWTGRSWKHEFWIQSKSNCQYENLEVPSGVNLDKDYIFKSIIISPCYAWNKIYKTEFLKLNNIKFSEARCFEDCIFIIDAMLQAKNISYVDSEFYIYRLRMSSTLRSLNNIEQESLNVFKEIYNAFKKYNLLNKLEQNLKFFYTMHSIWTMEKLDLQQQKEFLTTLKTVIPNDCYKLVKKKTLKLKYKKLINFANKIFYVTNKDRHKVINICGLKIKFEYYKKEQAKKEHDFINRITREHKRYHKNCYLLFDCLHDSTVECIDAYSLFKYMQSIGKKAYYVILEDSELYKQLERQGDLKYIISLKNSTLTNPGDFLEEVFPVLLQCKAIITSFGENSHVTNRFFKNNPHWQYIFIQHGQVLMPDRVFKTEYLYPEKFDKFLVSSENEYNIFKKYGWQDDKLLKAGLPRWDLLSERKQKERSILIMFTWRRHNLLSFEESLYKKNLLKLLNNKDLQTYLKDNNVKLYFAPHHALRYNQGINFDINNENIEIVNTNKISQYIKKCSCLITDFSSVSFDFMFQEEPVLFYILDKNDNTLNPLEKRGIDTFDYKKFILPNVFFKEEEVVSKLKYYVENNFELEQKSKEKYNKFFYTKENIRRKLVEEIDRCCT